MKLATVATTAALGAALSFASGAYAQSRTLQVIHCDEAWNVMSPDGLALGRLAHASRGRAYRRYARALPSRHASTLQGPGPANTK